MKQRTLSRRLTAALLALVMALSLTACGAAPSVTLADAGQDVSLLTPAVSRYMAGDVEDISRYGMGVKEASRPEPVHLSWTVSGKGAEGYELRVGEREDLADALTYETEEPAYDLYNCKTGTTYYWAVTTKLSGGKTAVSETGSFTTAAGAPRMIYCPGVTNMRDCGGWVTEDGKTVREGLLYRCGRLNANSVSEVQPTITDAGRAVMRELGIRTELDLRRADTNEVGGLTETGVLEGVRYVQCPMDGTEGTLLAANRAALPQVFAVLADESNYPLIYHCSIGTDRTGFVAYLAMGVLGVSQEDANRDYLLSNFGNIGSSRAISRVQGDYMDVIDAYPGASFQERVTAFLLDTGVTQAQVDAFRGIMLQ